MKKSLFSLSMFSLILLGGGFVPIGLAHNAGFPVLYYQNTLVIDTIAEPESLDPAWAYDTASRQVIMNVYETLVSFENKWTLGPYSSGQTTSFVPVLATSVPTAYITTGLPAGKVAMLVFTIARGRRFSDGKFVLPSDVAYSFKRELIQDRDGGPQWMLYYPLLGVYRAESPDTDPSFDDRIDSTVSADDIAGTVTIYLEVNFPLTAFLQILSQTWSSVVERAWAVSLGDFDGNFAASWAAIYAQWNNPSVSFVEGNMMGSGPFKPGCSYLGISYGISYSIDKNPYYWQGFPAPINWGHTEGERVPSSFDKIVWNVLPNWRSREQRFSTGNSDLTYVDRQFRDELLGQSGTRAYFPFDELALDAFFFTFDIATTSPYARWNSPSVFSATGIPPNIFSDVNVRRGFASAFDYYSWLTNAYLGEGSQPSDPIINGVAYNNPMEQGYVFNLSAAQTYLQNAWGGSLFANGMAFTIVYNQGNIGRQIAAETLANNINALNPQFNVRTLGVPWTTYLSQMVAGELPIFVMGWHADYTDLGNFVFPFMHSQGTFAASQGYSNPRADDLIDYGATLADDTSQYNNQLDAPNPIPLFNNYPSIPPDTFWPRRSIYYELQRIYFEDVPSVPFVQPIGRHFEQNWVRGWHHNPLFGGGLVSGLDSPTLDVYNLWKAQTHFGDANGDGKVDVRDLAYVSSHWTGPGGGGSRGILGYAPQADINGGKGGLTGTEYIPGMPDGYVDILDIGLISTYWDGPPQGPAHP